MRTMYDAITPGRIPIADPQIVGGYVGGDWPDFVTDVTMFPHALHLSIAVQPDERAHCLDVENGDALPSQAPGWVMDQIRAGDTDPWVYMSQSLWPDVIQAFLTQNVRMPIWWVANYDDIAALPAITYAGTLYTASAKQYRSTPGYDLSCVADHIPGFDPTTPEDTDMPTAAEIAAAVWAHPAIKPLQGTADNTITDARIGAVAARDAANAALAAIKVNNELIDQLIAVLKPASP